MKRQNDYERIAQYITASDLPRKPQKLDGLQRGAWKRIAMNLLRDPLTDNAAHDPGGRNRDLTLSELENGYWL